MLIQELIYQQRSQKVKELALQNGFGLCGISKAGFLEKEAPRLETWLNNNYNGKMEWMNNHFDKRLDPRILVEGAKSVISVLLNYYPEEQLPQGTDDLKISKYAYGKDYHYVLKDKLKQLVNDINHEIGEVNGRIFVDSAPVMDKVWAQKSGLGWIGKNTNLINKNNGSFFFIGEIICDMELAADQETTDHCGTCTRCIDACPTEAISEPYVVDGSKCISYFTIELKDAIPEEVKGKFENWIFGCDICQDVCPWNRFSKPHNIPEFQLPAELSKFRNRDWIEITEEIYKEVFRHSPLKRSKFEGISRNIQFVRNSESPVDL
jgi:epoxyqueuosine reductase